ncbi:caspase-3-like [Xyrauchen texanus]|uniref:caspase-3-like n=1 Tax=Xyrauchen texanus TaxID=154827 RepID=UPI002241F96C|nr:caspase-3-like [Xyrauchen texanus]
MMSICKLPFTASKSLKNRALIVSVENFYPGVDLMKRWGVKRDTQRLHKILTKLGFSVVIKQDMEAEEIYEVFKAESNKTVKDCFMGVISSHGEEGVVFGADGCPVRLAKIYSYFGGPSMTSKNKLFLIQACRGNELDEGVETDSSCSEEEKGMSELFSIPIDTAVMYATAPGYGAFMHPLGSAFIQTLCELLEQEGGPNLELTRLMTRLKYQVAYNFQAKGKTFCGKTQMPCFVTRFTREVFPFMDSRTAEDLNFSFAATKRIDEPKRSRRRSIS